MAAARRFSVLDLDHETGITVLGHVDEVATRIFSATNPAYVAFTRVFWTNPEDLDDAEWSYDEEPVYIRPGVVRAVGALPASQVHALERARIEAG